MAVFKDKTSTSKFKILNFGRKNQYLQVQNFELRTFATLIIINLKKFISVHDMDIHTSIMLHVIAIVLFLNPKEPRLLGGDFGEMKFVFNEFSFK